MKKKLLSIAAACVLGVQAIAMPMIANAEQGTHYVEKSDFNDVSIGGAKGTGYYGLGIIMDGSPWLSKGSASVHYQTFYHDDQRNVNYCNFWSNSDKTGSGDGAGSMYFYNRNLAKTMGPYGIAEYDVRLKADTQDFNFMMGWFEDPTSSGFNAATQVALNLRFSLNGVTANNGVRTENLATLQADKWYKVRVTLDNNFEEYSAVVTDVETGKVVGSLLDAAYQASIPSGVTGIKTTGWGYIRGNTYDFDLTNVTIGKSDTKYSAQ